MDRPPNVRGGNNFKLRQAGKVPNFQLGLTPIAKVGVSSVNPDYFAYLDMHDGRGQG